MLREERRETRDEDLASSLYELMGRFGGEPFISTLFWRDSEDFWRRVPKFQCLPGGS